MRWVRRARTAIDRVKLMTSCLGIAGLALFYTFAFRRAVLGNTGSMPSSTGDEGAGD